MVDPEATEKQFGLNAEPLIVSVPVSLVAFSDVQSLPPPPPQAAPVSASTTTVASKAFRPPTSTPATTPCFGLIGSLLPRRAPPRSSVARPEQGVPFDIRRRR